jgi:hypothetical protein
MKIAILIITTILLSFGFFKNFKKESVSNNSKETDLQKKLKNNGLYEEEIIVAGTVCGICTE